MVTQGRSYKRQAQQRADRIAAFWEEMQCLEQEQALTLPEDERRVLRRHHDQILEELSRQFEVDTTKVQKQLSLGMRIASLLGALSFSAAVLLFAYHFWDRFSTAARVLILLTAPVAGLVAVARVTMRERTLYFAPMLGMLAFTAFGLNLALFRELFNLTPSATGLLALCIFAFIVAYTYNLRFVLIAGIISFLCYLSATFGAARGVYWLSLGQRPEDFILAGPVIVALSLAPHRQYPGFPRVYRVSGLIAVFLAMLFLASYGDLSYLSYLSWSTKPVEYFYQAASFVVSGATICLGVRWRLQDVVVNGNVFFILFLYTRFFAWWWPWMPAYLFFFIVGVITVGLLFYLKWLRRFTLEQPT